MKIYLVRHGESEDAKNNLYQTFITPLSEKGQLQAESITRKLKNIEFSAIYSSPLPRAKQTAEIINQQYKLPIQILEDLQEEKRPTEIEGKSKVDPINLAIVSKIESNYTDTHWRYSDEDTFSHVFERANKIKYFFEGLDEGNYLVVTHGVILKMLAALILNKELNATTYIKNSSALIIDNTGIVILEYSKPIWTINGWNLTQI